MSTAAAHRKKPRKRFRYHVRRGVHCVPPAPYLRGEAFAEPPPPTPAAPVAVRVRDPHLAGGFFARLPFDGPRAASAAA